VSACARKLDAIALKSAQPRHPLHVAHQAATRFLSLSGGFCLVKISPQNVLCRGRAVLHKRCASRCSAWLQVQRRKHQHRPFSAIRGGRCASFQPRPDIDRHLRAQGPAGRRGRGGASKGVVCVGRICVIARALRLERGRILNPGALSVSHAARAIN